MLKDESIEQAFRRLLKIELGIEYSVPTFKGGYQQFYCDKFLKMISHTHYVVLAYEINFNGDIDCLPEVQHYDYDWFSEEPLLNNIDVHNYTKWCFQTDKQADSLMTNIKVKIK